MISCRKHVLVFPIRVRFGGAIILSFGILYGVCAAPVNDSAAVCKVASCEVRVPCKKKNQKKQKDAPAPVVPVQQNFGWGKAIPPPPNNLGQNQIQAPDFQKFEGVVMSADEHGCTVRLTGHRVLSAGPLPPSSVGSDDAESMGTWDTRIEYGLKTVFRKSNTKAEVSSAKVADVQKGKTVTVTAQKGEAIIVMLTAEPE